MKLEIDDSWAPALCSERRTPDSAGFCPYWQRSYQERGLTPGVFRTASAVCVYHYLPMLVETTTRPFYVVNDVSVAACIRI